VVPPELDGRRIDAALAALLVPPDLGVASRSACGSLLDRGRVSLVSARGRDDGSSGASRHGEPVRRKSHKVRAGQELRVLLDPIPASDGVVPQNLPLDVLYEDDCMIVLNKSPHMVVHPGAGNRDGTLVNALAYYLAHNTTKGSGDCFGGGGAGAASGRPGIVHRLDKGTSGVIAVAKTAAAHARLSEAFAHRRVRKTYLAVCVGDPCSGPGSASSSSSFPPSEGRPPLVIDEPVGRHPVHRQKMRVVPEVHRPGGGGGRRAVSIVGTLASHGKLSLVRVRILTGRTHQIRVHLQHLGTPVGGDDLYGSADWNRRLAKSHGVSRPLLHAYGLELEHPATGELLRFSAPMPPDMARVAVAIYPHGPDERPGLFPHER
jgi:23S rRNA pseudouridine1911/1915/1917 synthase